jgi:hypothetical protein
MNYLNPKPKKVKVKKNAELRKIQDIRPKNANHNTNTKDSLIENLTNTIYSRTNLESECSNRTEKKHIIRKVKVPNKKHNNHVVSSSSSSSSSSFSDSGSSLTNPFDLQVSDLFTDYISKLKKTEYGKLINSALLLRVAINIGIPLTKFETNIPKKATFDELVYNIEKWDNDTFKKVYILKKFLLNIINQ